MQEVIFVVSQKNSYKKKKAFNGKKARTKIASRGMIYPVILRVAFSPNDIVGTPSSQPVENVKTNSIEPRYLEFVEGR